MAMEKPVISIDWDQTLRTMEGLDLNILSLVFYAKAKNIPVGITTHRDIENTTLFSLYYWQFKRPVNNAVALAAAIHYWQKNLLDTFNIKPDFISARYQPLYAEKNYYETVLLPHELNLAFDILKKKILRDPGLVKDTIMQYQHLKEAPMENNEFKGAQLNWLAKTYAGQFNGTIYHIDDNQQVCDYAFAEFQKVTDMAHVKINTLYYENAPLLSNSFCMSLLQDIGLLSDWKKFLRSRYSPFDNNNLLYLSLCLFATQVMDKEIEILCQIEENLQKIQLEVNDKNVNLRRFILKVIQQIKTTQKPLYFLLNEWVESEQS